MKDLSKDPLRTIRATTQGPRFTVTSNSHERIPEKWASPLSSLLDLDLILQPTYNCLQHFDKRYRSRVERILSLRLRHRFGVPVRRSAHCQA